MGNNKCRVFLAGPMFSSGSMGNNLRNAFRIATRLRKEGFLVHVPHMCFLWDLMLPEEREFWVEMDLEWLETCHVIYRMPGSSMGADDEVAHASSSGVEIYSDKADPHGGDLPELRRLIVNYPGGSLK